MQRACAWTRVALVALVLGACGGRQTSQTSQTTPWFKVQQETPRTVAPHVLAIGTKQTHIMTRGGDGHWSRVGSFSFTGPLVAYAGGRYAVIRVDDERGPRMLGLTAGAPAVQLPDCTALRVADDRASVACVECDGACERLRITTYRAPRDAPEVVEIAIPADACTAARVQWLDPQLAPDWPPTVVASCAGTTAAEVFWELDVPGRRLRQVYRRTGGR